MTTRERIAAYVRLAKPGIVRMVMITAAFGFLMARGGLPAWGEWFRLLVAVVGIGLAAAGAAVLNNFLERDLDARMDRTHRRELPRGVIPPPHALSYGMLLVLAGVGLLLVCVNLPTAFLALLSAFLYVVVYTPLKRMTWLNTSIGAIPGALPIACGWTAASEAGTLGFGGWIAFAILYAWQHPHFYAIAWMYRTDYAKAGFRMLSVTDPSGTKLCLHTLLYCVFLLVVSVIPTVVGTTDWVYLVGVVAAGGWMLWLSVKFARSRTDKDARRLFFSSLVYLPALLVVLTMDLGLASLGL